MFQSTLFHLTGYFMEKTYMFTFPFTYASQGTEFYYLSDSPIRYEKTLKKEFFFHRMASTICCCSSMNCFMALIIFSSCLLVLLILYNHKNLEGKQKIEKQCLDSHKEL